MAITPLPPAPQVTDDTATFNAKAFAWVDSIDTFTTEANATATQVNADATTAASAAEAADAALGAANFKGEWSTLTGALAIPASVSHNDSVWLLTENLADVTANEPGVGSPIVWLNLTPSAGGGFSEAQVFTSSGSFTVPDSGKFKVTIIGGGASGGSRYDSAASGGGGGSGGSIIKWFSGATAGATATVTVGSAGASVTNASGNSGGSSTFVLSGFTTLTANGGSGGSEYITAGVGGTASGGDVNIDGQRGGDAGYSDTDQNIATIGGSTILGLGGVKFSLVTGVSATGYGGGGTGGNLANPSGAGRAGICIVEY